MLWPGLAPLGLSSVPRPLASRAPPNFASLLPTRLLAEAPSSPASCILPVFPLLSPNREESNPPLKCLGPRNTCEEVTQETSFGGRENVPCGGGQERRKGEQTEDRAPGHIAHTSKRSPFLQAHEPVTRTQASPALGALEWSTAHPALRASPDKVGGALELEPRRRGRQLWGKGRARPSCAQCSSPRGPPHFWARRWGPSAASVEGGGPGGQKREMKKRRLPGWGESPKRPPCESPG